MWKLLNICYVQPSLKVLILVRKGSKDKKKQGVVANGESV